MPPPTQLHIAVKARQLDVERIASLLEAKADANAEDFLGMTPLHYALGEKRGPGSTEKVIEVIEMLLMAGADANKTNDAQETPLQYSIVEEHAIRKLLMPNVIISLRLNHQSRLTCTSASGEEFAIFPLEEPVIKEGRIHLKWLRDHIYSKLNADDGFLEKTVSLVLPDGQLLPDLNDYADVQCLLQDGQLLPDLNDYADVQCLLQLGSTRSISTAERWLQGH